MGEERYQHPNQVLFSVLHGVKALQRHPLLSREACVHQDLWDLGLLAMQELKAVCAQLGAWGSVLYKLTHCCSAPGHLSQHACVVAQRTAETEAAAAAGMHTQEPCTWLSLLGHLGSSSVICSIGPVTGPNSLRVLVPGQYPTDGVIHGLVVLFLHLGRFAYAFNLCGQICQKHM